MSPELKAPVKSPQFAPTDTDQPAAPPAGPAARNEPNAPAPPPAPPAS